MLKTPTLKPYTAKTPEVRALLGGATQLRVPMNPQPEHSQIHEYKGKVLYDGEARRWCWKQYVGADHWDDITTQIGHGCPFGKPGDRIWIRETWFISSTDTGSVSIGYKERLPEGKTLADTDGGLDLFYVSGEIERWAAERTGDTWRSPATMPEWASRLRYDLVDVRVQRLGEISSFDAEDSGIDLWAFPGDHRQGNETQFQACFRLWWEATHGPWDPRQWVFALTVKRVGEGE